MADPSETTHECPPPVVALTVRDGERVVAAYPHPDGDDHRGVDEALALLGSGDGPSVGIEAAETQQGAAD